MLDFGEFKSPLACSFAKRQSLTRRISFEISEKDTVKGLKDMKILGYTLCYGLVLVLLGCAGTQKAELASPDSLDGAVYEVTGLKKTADVVQAELLSFREYRKGSEFLAKAQKGLAGGYKADYVLDNAARGKTQLQAAIQNARDRTPNAVRILEARKSALDAGLKASPDLAEVLEEVDDDVRDDTDNFEHPLEPKDFSKYQKQYFSLEVLAVQFRELDGVKTAIQEAIGQDAEYLAPDTLRTAMLDLSEAENLIAQSPRDPSIYQYVLDLAIESSVLLTDVMEVILNARGTLGRLLERGVIPVVNENDTVATDEIRYGDNDRLAARVAQLVMADALVLLSDVDGFYTADPGKDANAKHIAEVTRITGEMQSMAGETVCARPGRVRRC